MPAEKRWVETNPPEECPACDCPCMLEDTSKTFEIYNLEGKLHSQGIRMKCPECFVEILVPILEEPGKEEPGQAGLPHKYRPYRCCGCGAVKDIKTNHTMTVYMQKCPNWPCTPGTGQYRNFQYYPGEVREIVPSFVDERGNETKLKVSSFWNDLKVV